MDIRVLIWAVFFAGALASRYFFGVEGRIVYGFALALLVTLFHKPLTIWLTHVASRLGLMKATIGKMPNTIKLARAAGIDEPALPVAAELRRAGFSDAGAWDIPPMPKIKLALMAHRADNFLAAIETAAAIGAQLNIHTLYADGSVVTYTNSRMPPPKAERPGQTMVRMPGTEPAALLAKARRERRSDGITAVNVNEAPRIYERLYADAIKFRKQLGA
jgi:hypothetical protein